MATNATSSILIRFFVTVVISHLSILLLILILITTTTTNQGQYSYDHHLRML